MYYGGPSLIITRYDFDHVFLSNTESKAHPGWMGPPFIKVLRAISDCFKQ